MLSGFIIKKMGKNHEVKLKLKKEEKERLDRRARELGIPISTYIRMVSLKYEVRVGEKK